MRRSSRRKRSKHASLSEGSFNSEIIIEDESFVSLTPVRKKKRRKKKESPKPSPIVIDLCDVSSEEEEEVQVVPQPRTRRAKRKRKKLLLDNALRRNTCVRTAFGEGFVRNVRVPDYEGWQDDEELELMYVVTSNHTRNRPRSVENNNKKNTYQCFIPKDSSLTFLNTGTQVRSRTELVYSFLYKLKNVEHVWTVGTIFCSGSTDL